MLSLVRDGESFFRSEGTVFCPLLDVDVRVLVHTDGAEVRSNQLRALGGFLSIPAIERSHITQRLYADYREVSQAVGEGPEISDAGRVWDFVQWTDVLVPLQGTSGCRFLCVRGEPAWETEHGVEMWFRDERLVRLDRNSGAFLSSCFWSWE